RSASVPTSGRSGGNGSTWISCTASAALPGNEAGPVKPGTPATIVNAPYNSATKSGQSSHAIKNIRRAERWPPWTAIVGEFSSSSKETDMGVRKISGTECLILTRRREDAKKKSRRRGMDVLRQWRGRKPLHNDFSFIP